MDTSMSSPSTVDARTCRSWMSSSSSNATGRTYRWHAPQWRQLIPRQRPRRSGPRTEPGAQERCDGAGALEPGDVADVVDDGDVCVRERVGEIVDREGRSRVAGAVDEERRDLERLALP